MKKLTGTIALILLLATTILLLAGCAKETEETKITPSESNRWLELLRVLPSNENTIKATYLSDWTYTAEKMPDVEEIKNKAWSEGYNKAEKGYQIWYYCAVCRKRIDVEPNSDSHKAMIGYMEEHRWGHASCHEH